MSFCLKQCFIIDIASIRGTEDEVRLLDECSQNIQVSESEPEDGSLLIKIVIGMINMIMQLVNDSITELELEIGSYEVLKLKRLI